TRNLFSNALPPFIEPIIFLMGIGLGLGANIGPMQGLPYVRFLAFGLLMTAAMFTAAFEMSYGTYIRLMFDKIYDSMMGAPLTALDIMLGEILWCGTKGGVFTASVLVICLAFGALPLGWIVLSPVIGFLTGLMFAVLALLATTVVSNISNFNFFFSGLLSPMFFFSGVVFPLSSLPHFLLPVAEVLPLTHPVRLVRGFATGFGLIHLWDLGYCAIFILLVGWVAIRRITGKLVD
ncbi:MAG TPA: ABC transporter permease, partial [Spirochaetia bacterium]|nr:ABC transporter permease [Spirochaetia bacterium]